MLARNVTHFMRLLRDAGFGLSPAHAVDALDALRHIDIGARGEVRAALAALVLSGPDQRPLFDAALRPVLARPRLGRQDARDAAATRGRRRAAAKAQQPARSMRSPRASRPRRPASLTSPPARSASPPR